MTSFPFLLTSNDGKPSNGSSPSTSSFSIDTLLSSPMQMPQLRASFQDALNSTFNPWSLQQFPFVSMLCSPLMPQFVAPYQHLSSRRKRRHRTIFSEEQLNILETTFLSTHYPDVATREKLAIQCALKEERVEVWFKNRRAKERKQKRDDGNSGSSAKLSDGSECDDSDEEEHKLAPHKKMKKETSSPEMSKSIKNEST